jgi:HAD superfamily hydrolase (TIGR01509 family)
MHNNLKLVIFDMDGVLVDACDWHKIALNEALKEVSGYEIPLEDHYKKYNGLPTKVKLNMLIKEGHVQEKDLESIYEMKQLKTVDIIKRESVVKEEKIELMKWLHDSEISVACFTNSIRMTAQLMLERAGVYEHLDLLVTNQDVSSPKPNPEGYIKALKHFNCSPKDAIIVEDSPKGLEAAEKSGANILKVENATFVTTNTVKRYINENFNSNGR